jgi:hypothetical protein
VRRIALVVSVVGLAFVAHGASAESVSRTAHTCLRFHGALYFDHELRVLRPRLGRRLGIGLERVCVAPPGEDPPPWAPISIFALSGIRTAVAVAPSRRGVVFYDPYRCSPRRGERRFLRCLEGG